MAHALAPLEVLARKRLGFDQPAGEQLDLHARRPDPEGGDRVPDFLRERAGEAGELAAPLDVSSGRLELAAERRPHGSRVRRNGVVAQLALHACDRCVQMVRTPAERGAQPGERVRCLCVVARAAGVVQRTLERLPLLSELTTGVVAVGDRGPRLCKAEVVAGRLEHRYRFIRGRKHRLPVRLGVVLRSIEAHEYLHPPVTQLARDPLSLRENPAGSTWSNWPEKKSMALRRRRRSGRSGAFWVSGRRLAERGSRRRARRLAPDPAAQPHKAVPRRAYRANTRGH